MSRQLIRPILEFSILNRYVGHRLNVVWHAGEPLIVPPDFYDEALSLAAVIARSRPEGPINIQHSVQTNGTLLSQAWCDLFRKYSVHVGVSLDGPRELHDARRMTRAKKGTYDKVIAGVDLLVRNGMEFSVVTVLTEQALRNPDLLFSFYKDHSIRRVGFNIDEVTGANSFSSVGRSQLEDLYKKFMARMLELTDSEGQTLQIRDFKRYKRLILSGVKYTLNQLCRPLAVLAINCDGYFSTFCPELLTACSNAYPEGFTIGNVMRDTLEDALRSPRFLRMRSEIMAGVEKCRGTCDYFGLCGGGAPSNKLFENGTFACAETTFCRFTRKALIDVTLADLERKVAAA